MDAGTDKDVEFGPLADGENTTDDGEVRPPTDEEINPPSDDRTAATGAVSGTEERRVIVGAIAHGYEVTRWIAVVIGLLFIASGLWWAGILVVAVTTFDLPRRAAQRYARKHGVQLDIPSSNEVQKTSLSGLFFGVVFIPAICGLAVAEAKLGHPLLPWSWTSGQYQEDELFFIAPFVFVGLVVTIAWLVRRRSQNRQHKGDVNQ